MDTVERRFFLAWLTEDLRFADGTWANEQAEERGLKGMGVGDFHFLKDIRLVKRAHGLELINA